MEPALKEYIRGKQKNTVNVLDSITKLIHVVGDDSDVGATLAVAATAYKEEMETGKRGHKNSGPRRGLFVAFAVGDNVFIGYSLCSKRDVFSDTDAEKYAVGNAILGFDCKYPMIKKNSPVTNIRLKDGNTVSIVRPDKTPVPADHYAIPMSIMTQLKEFVARTRKYYDNPNFSGPKKTFPAWTEVL